jgi:hypothetical protein
MIVAVAGRFWRWLSMVLLAPGILDTFEGIDQAQLLTVVTAHRRFGPQLPGARLAASMSVGREAGRLQADGLPYLVLVLREFPSGEFSG